MFKIIRSSVESAFSNVFATLVVFVVSIFAASLLIKSVGVLTIPIDRARDVDIAGKGSDLTSDVGILFILKNMSASSSSTDVSLEINEISDAKIFSGVGSTQPIKNDTPIVAEQRYLRIEDIRLPRNARADYAVIGKSSGGKISGSVLIGQEEAAGCVFLTDSQFYISCFCFFVFGGIVVGLANYYITVAKQKQVS